MNPRARLTKLAAGPAPWLLLASLLRVTYWLQASREPWFVFPEVDPEFYTRWADAILAGRAAEYIPFPRAPFYAYVLAGIRAVLGTAWIWPRLLNLGFDWITILTVFALGRRLRGPTTARIAAALVAVSGASVYFSGEVLMTSCATALAAVTTLLLADCLTSLRARRGALTGVCLALWALLRPHALVLVPCTLALLRPWRGRRHAAVAGAHLLGVLLPLLPITALNYSASRTLVPVTLQGGVNFYIGNARGADGWSAVLPGVGGVWQEADAQRLAERLAGRPLAPAQVSSLFWRLGLAEIHADPAAWLRLLGRKLLLLVNRREMGNNRPLVLAVQVAPQMAVLFLCSLGLLFPLALLGWSRTRGQPENTALASIALVYAGSLLLFFVNARFRLPVFPAVAVFAAAGATALPSLLRSRGVAWPALAWISAGALLAFPPWGMWSHDEMAQAHYVAGNGWLHQQHAREALQRYDQALAIDPSFPDLYLNRGIALSMLGDRQGAEQSFQRELALDPADGRAWNNLGVLAEKQKEWARAEDCYRRALQATPWQDDARHNLGTILMRRAAAALDIGRASRADSLLREAEAFLPASPQLAQLRGRAAVGLGDTAAARSRPSPSAPRLP
ncbi:MAG TPA: tetratricopeptide repeat protein [Candidatus Krumholzibacteria bacterium]|nr:tetratricopeptide repeat protein [Candidatus Krumholzibacteria bacterium]